MGLFNRGMTDANRKNIAAELAKFLKVEEAVPDSFEGIPLLNPMKSWFFPPEIKRDAGQIDSLWSVFAAGLEYADAEARGGKGGQVARPRRRGTEDHVREPRVVSLQEALQLPNLIAYNRRATGEKFLIAPHKAG
jgi:hypothetical protein